MLVFSWELARLAAISTWESFHVDIYAWVVGVGFPVATILWKLWFEGREGVMRHWQQNLRHVVTMFCLAFVVIWAYKFLWEIPSGIRARANTISLPTPPPSGLPAATLPEAPSKRAQLTVALPKIVQGDCSVLQIGDNNQAAVGPCKPLEAKLMASEQSRRQTGDPASPWVTEFRITATAPVMTGNLRLKCSGNVIRAGIGRINPASFSSGANGPDPLDPTVVIYELGPEPLEPNRDVTVAVFSLTPVTVLSGTLGSTKITFTPAER